MLARRGPACWLTNPELAAARQRQLRSVVAMSTIVPAYYVSLTGSDSNPGTIDAPFATLQRAQEAMQNSDIKTTYILAGDYSPAATASSPFGNAVLNLTSADSGETWSYYPADGYGSAQISGGGNITTFMSINGATGVTVNGLDISNFTAIGINVTNGSSNATIINNKIHDMPQLGLAIDDSGASVNNTIISNNYLDNIGSNGISIYSVHGHGNINNTISNNFIINSATMVSDSGAIYAQDLNPKASIGNTITNNYIGTSGDVAIYLDDGASNYTVTGNILDPGPTAHALVQIHGGNNNVFSGNIGDLSTGLMDGFVFYQQSVNNGARGMTGNVWEDNILVGDIASGGGSGYVGSLDPPAPLTIQDNNYWNYGTGGNLVSTGSDGAGSDANPTDEDPQLAGSAYSIALSSPVFSPPVNFPGVIGGWGPPGLVQPDPQTVLGGAGINTVYSDVLGRAASAAEQAAWVAAESSGMLSAAQVIADIVNSPEAQGSSWAIVRLYQAAFGRVPDAAGFTADVDFLDPAAGGTGTLLQVAEDVVASAEFQSTYGNPNTPATLAACIEALYQNVLGRTGSTAEVDAWLATGESAAQILIGLSNSAEFQATANPAVASLLTINALTETITTGSLFQTAITGAASAQTAGDGTQTASLALLGQYAAAGFATAPGQGQGALVAHTAPADATAPTLLTTPQH